MESPTPEAPGTGIEVSASYKDKVLLTVTVLTDDPELAITTARQMGFAAFLQWAVVVKSMAASPTH